RRVRRERRAPLRRHRRYLPRHRPDRPQGSDDMHRLLSLVPVGMAIDGIFTLESFFPHFLGYLVAIGSTVVSFLVVGSVLRGVARWRWLGSGLRLGGGLTLVLLALAQLTFDPIAAGANVGIAGLTERLVV